MEGFSNIDKGLQAELQISNKQFKSWLDNLDNEVTEFDKKIGKRKTIATVLKLIVVVSGVAIATGFLLDWIVQVIGAFVSLITAIERVFANLDRLLSEVAAKDAYNRVRREVVKIHEKRIGKLVGMKQNEPDKAAGLIIELQSELRDKLIDVDDKIKTSLENKNYELLGRLTLDDNKE